VFNVARTVPRASPVGSVDGVRLGHVAMTGTVLVTLLSGCSGQSCEELPALRAERDEARADYLELATPGTAPADETEEADSALHALERRVYDVEQGCEGR
jgi:hypothetical protein